jgi:hypothetical protein
VSYRVTIHSAAPVGHHGKAHVETFDRRADAEQYRRDALAEDPTATTHVTGQHEEPAVPRERAREWMAHLNAIWAAAPPKAEHKHANGWENCPICGRMSQH